MLIKVSIELFQYFMNQLVYSTKTWNKTIKLWCIGFEGVVWVQFWSLCTRILVCERSQNSTRNEDTRCLSPFTSRRALRQPRRTVPFLRGSPTAARDLVMEGIDRSPCRILNGPVEGGCWRGVSSLRPFVYSEIVLLTDDTSSNDRGSLNVDQVIATWATENTTHAWRKPFNDH